MTTHRARRHRAAARSRDGGLAAATRERLRNTRHAVLAARPRQLVWGLAATAGLIVVFLFYLWTAATNPTTFPTKMSVGDSDYFNLLADAYRAGQVSLLVEPDPALLALPDPYFGPDSARANRLHDLSLYDRKYYMYWGPTPVLTLFLPARLILPNDLPEHWAVVIYAFAGLLVSLALLRHLVRRYLPRTPTWMQAAGGLALATSSVLPYTLRRPTVYEVAITAGFFFLMLGVYLLLTGALEERVRRWRLAAGSLSLGVAAGARPSLAVSGVLAAALLVHLARHPAMRSWTERAKTAALLLGPIGLCGVALLLYNRIRFDSFTEFGLRYQLNDIEPYATDGLLAHTVPSLYFYLLAPARLNLDFPYFHVPPPPDYPGRIPDGYNWEFVQGLIPNVPIVLVLLIGLPLALRSPDAHMRRLGAIMALLCGLGLIIVVSISVVLYGATMRYAVDFTSLFLIAALLGWFLVAGSHRRWTRRAAVIGGTALVVYGAVLGIGISIRGYTDGLRAAQPKTYDQLERFFSPLPTAATMLTGRPVMTEVLNPGGAPSARIGYGTAGSGRDVTFSISHLPATVEITSPDRRSVRLRARTAATPAVPDAPLSLVVTSQETGRSISQPVSSQHIDLAVALRRGLNRFEVRVAGAPPLPPGADPRTSLLVDVADLHIAAG